MFQTFLQTTDKKEETMCKLINRDAVKRRLNFNDNNENIFKNLNNFCEQNESE